MVLATSAASSAPTRTVIMLACGWGYGAWREENSDWGAPKSTENFQNSASSLRDEGLLDISESADHGSSALSEKAELGFQSEAAEV